MRQHLAASLGARVAESGIGKLGKAAEIVNDGAIGPGFERAGPTIRVLLTLAGNQCARGLEAWG